MRHVCIAFKPLTAGIRERARYRMRSFLVSPAACALSLRGMSGMPAASLEEVAKRVSALESRVNQALQQKTQHPRAPPAWHGDQHTSQQQDQPPEGADWGKPKEELPEDASATGKAADKAAGVMDDAVEEAVQRLHPALIKFLNSGYLVSQQQLRQRLMQTDWEDSLRPLAMRKGLAAFEQWLAEHGEQEGIRVGWTQLQALYHNPEDLSPLDDNPRARMLAHAMIQHAMIDKQLEVFRACTDTAKQLANVMESGQRTGASTLLGALRRLLPIPFLR